MTTHNRLLAACSSRAVALRKGKKREVHSLAIQRNAERLPAGRGGEEKEEEGVNKEMNLEQQKSQVKEVADGTPVAELLRVQEEEILRTYEIADVKKLGDFAGRV